MKILSLIFYIYGFVLISLAVVGLTGSQSYGVLTFGTGLVLLSIMLAFFTKR